MLKNKISVYTIEFGSCGRNYYTSLGRKGGLFSGKCWNFLVKINLTDFPRLKNNHVQKNETGPLSHTIHKISQNVTPATIRLLEENIGSKQLDINLGNNF